ncbi:MAG TPA: UbiD family decarboxylase [Xanthobacteraceae bacterium]|nr:UbiD family decarboxylase [Xanthobacteraceae bacterium]
MNEIDRRTVARADAVSKQDLRAWLAQMEAAGEVKHISGANREEEIGGIVDAYQRRIGNPAVLFDDIPGYPRGYRVLANILTSVKRINLTLGNPADASEMDLVRWWRRYMKEAKSIPPVTRPTGAVMENVLEGKDIDLFKIPVPKWHEHDGGYYIGTGDLVVMRDPDTGWINYGAYRVQAHGPQLASVMCSKGKHGDMIQRKYFERGEPCPVAVVCGMHPALFMIAGLEIPHGKNEYDAAGGLIGEPVEVVLGPKTGLPIPAHAEIAFEGFIHPNDRVKEGPLGEWTGYYAGGVKQEPAIRVETFMHRNDPILLGAIPGIPPDDDSFYRGTYRSGAVWNQLEAAGVPEVKGVWAHAAGGSRLWLTVSIKQMYAGHSKQAGLIASQCHAGAYVNRFVVVVDDDIDPADMDRVVWAMCTRFDPREGLEVLRGCWSSALDPMAYAPDDPRNARVVIDACRPWSRRATFPLEARASKELEARIRAKFGKDLPKGT